MSTLRPYQEAAIKGALNALSRQGSVVLQMPTGSGKTRTATEIIREAQGVVWFICHRQEIERQAAAAFAAAGIDFGIVSPRAELDHSKRVQIVSVASKCLAEMPQPVLVIWDECHHVPAKSWDTLHASLSDARHLGLTATPERLDGKGLKDWFAELIVGPSISELVEQGHLSPFRYFAPSEPDMTAAKLQAGDYRKKDADAAMNTPVLIGDAVAEYRRSANGKRAIAFCTSVEASKALVERFNAEGILAAHMDGNSGDDERKKAVDDLASGEIKVLSNVEVFTEGFDVPGIEAVILLRPTKSVTLLLQMIGRALRYVDGKTAVIMDHAGLHRDHGWFASDWQWSIDGGSAEARRMGGGGVRRCPECKEVRGERVEACACGYEFPTGRDVGEFDGVLHEVRGDVPNGWATRIAFARRIGRDPAIVAKWMVRGLPCNLTKDIVEIEPSLDWIKSNTATTRFNMDEEHCGQSDFAKMVGSRQSAIRRLVGKGLPTNEFGHINISLGIKWYADHMSLKVVPAGKATVREFANHICRSEAVVYTWVRQGNISKDDRGLIDVASATIFANSRKPPRNLPPPSGHLRPKHFGQLFGRDGAIVIGWIERGLPKNGEFIPIKSGAAWVKDNVKFSAVGTGDPEFESRSNFATRCKLFDKRGRPYASMVHHYAKSGLPCASNGWVHIQRGLEWVRDKTNIEIPPEAWPAANDNGKQQMEDAA